MATTVSGYPVLDGDTTGSYPRLRVWNIPGTSRHITLRDGAFGFILIHFALWFHENVERLDAHGEPWDEWGWAKRPVRGQTTGFSNHAGGGAEDLNATRHPREIPASRTFTKKQIRAIKLRLKLYRGFIIWGAFWRIPDGMHFEIAGGKTLSVMSRFVRVYLINTPRGRRILKANPGAKTVILNHH